MQNKPIDEFINELHNEVINQLADNQSNSQLRLGQRYYNALHNLRPDIAEKIAGTDADCFYDDRKMAEFWLAVQKHY